LGRKQPKLASFFLNKGASTSSLSSSSSSTSIPTSSSCSSASGEKPDLVEETDPKKKLFSLLKKHFKYDRFKSDTQEAAIFEIIKRQKDVYVSMPTGAGKSLCYQLPALMHNGVTMGDYKILEILRGLIKTLIYFISKVVSPLIALIHDQGYSIIFSNSF